MVHAEHHPKGREAVRKVINGDDVHFAIRVDEFDAAMDHLQRTRFRDTDDERDPLGVIVKRSGTAGFPQVYIMDPERHVIEINAAR